VSRDRETIAITWILGDMSFSEMLDGGIIIRRHAPDRRIASEKTYNSLCELKSCSTNDAQRSPTK